MMSVPDVIIMKTQSKIELTLYIPLIFITINMRIRNVTLSLLSFTADAKLNYKEYHGWLAQDLTIRKKNHGTASINDIPSSLRYPCRLMVVANEMHWIIYLSNRDDPAFSNQWLMSVSDQINFTLGSKKIFWYSYNQIYDFWLWLLIIKNDNKLLLSPM